jgi:N-acetylmuramoyl-L-alanine amidase
MDQGLKRRLLSEAVEENLRAIRNQPRRRSAARRRFTWSFAVAALAVVLAVAALGVALRPPRPALVPARGADPAAASAAPAVEAPAALAAPARVPGSVFPVAVRRIAIDPGHGGGDLGTHTPHGLVEKDLTLDLAQRVAARLRERGFEPTLTRSSDTRVHLADRARLAKEAGADLFVSIHVNWFEHGRAYRGIETFYLGPSDDPYVTELASLENRESGYSMADVRRLLDSIYADLRQEQSRALAAAVQERLLRSIREVAPEVRDRGVKSAPFLVLVATEMPAILAEVASLSNAEEARLLGRPEYRDRLAEALVDGIGAYAHAVRRSGPVESGPERKGAR